MAIDRIKASYVIVKVGVRKRMEKIKVLEETQKTLLLEDSFMNNQDKLIKMTASRIMKNNPAIVEILYVSAI